MSSSLLPHVYEHLLGFVCVESEIVLLTPFHYRLATSLLYAVWSPPVISPVISKDDVILMGGDAADTDSENT